MKIRFRHGSWGVAFVWLAFWGLAVTGSGAPEGKGPVIKLNAQLIWGTNDEKSPEPSHKEVDAALRKRLNGVFKWQNYFEVSRQAVSVPLKKTVRLKLSGDCEVEVTNQGGNQIQAKLFGKGEFQICKTHVMKADEIFSVAGHAKNGTAWFVVFTLAEK
ncbi:MAG: hypothetical protein HY301_17765 [Verrucomicrobia bacterium]|nr:hypothetical protein [Verrucomicrobiota bacterium]